MPSVIAERNQVPLIGRIDVQRDFESLIHASREFDELPEFMGLQPIGRTRVLGRTIGTPPARDRAERTGVPGGTRGPVFQHHRLANRPPGDAAGRDGATGASDVLADGVIEVVALQTRPRISRRMPELSVPGIEVDIDPAGDHPHPGVRPMTGDVHEGARGSHEVIQLGGGEAVGWPVVAGQRRQVGEAELLGHLAEVLPIGRLLERARAARGVHAAVRSDLLDERDFKAQGLQVRAPSSSGSRPRHRCAACWPEHR